MKEKQQESTMLSGPKSRLRSPNASPNVPIGSTRNHVNLTKVNNKVDQTMVVFLCIFKTFYEKS